MKIALFGFGKMGKTVETLALKEGHEIILRGTSSTLDFFHLEEADICIDFSAPQAVLDNIKHAAKFKKNLVIGTTGWETNLSAIKHFIEGEQIGVLFAPNFSLGMFLFKELVKTASELLADFDVAGVEIHHNQKKDHPSGTAKELSNLFNRNVSFSSVRVGQTFGIHQLLFNSSDDTIELTHRAISRDGFAKGALEAAKWLIGKKGFFSLEDFMREKVCSLKG